MLARHYLANNPDSRINPALWGGRPQLLKSVRRLRKMLHSPGSLRRPDLARVRLQLIFDKTERRGMKTWRVIAGSAAELTSEFSE